MESLAVNFEIADKEELSSVFAGTGWGNQFAPTKKHLDLTQMFTHLLLNPADTVKVFAGSEVEKKQHTAHIYADRRNIEIATRTKSGWLYVRLREQPRKKEPRKSFQVTTAAEWRELRRA